MFPLAIRIPLVVAATVIGVLHLPESPWRGAIYLFAAALLVLGHFRYGTVWFAFRAYRKGNHTEARRLLDRIGNPDHLSPQYRPYHDWMRGDFARRDGNPERALELLDRAFAGGITKDHPRCAVALLIVSTLLDLGDRETAAEMLAHAREIPHRPSLDPTFRELEARLRSAAED